VGLITKENGRIKSALGHPTNNSYCLLNDGRCNDAWMNLWIMQNEGFDLRNTPAIPEAGAKVMQVHLRLDLFERPTFGDSTKDQANHLGFFGDDFKFSILTQSIAEDL
jgi:hypothetical protein